MAQALTRIDDTSARNLLGLVESVRDAGFTVALVGVPDRTLAFLHEHAIPYVVVDEPQGFRSSVPTVLEVTSPDLAIVRFHGRNAATWEAKGLSASQRFNYLYGEDELAERVTDVRQLAREAKEVHLIFNNCYANYGTTNARQIAELLLR